MAKDLHELPKLRDSISYLYIEHAVIEQKDSSIVMIQADGRIPVPVSSLTCLLLGPERALRTLPFEPAPIAAADCYRADARLN